MSGLEGHPQFIAHAHPKGDGSYNVHDVADHLRDVAKRARDFAAPFKSGDWAFLVGLWHDLGKYHPDFQRYIANVTGFDPEAHLEGAPGRVDHSTLGAVHALRRFDLPGRILAYPIAGHHAGLPDWFPDETGRAALSQRVAENEPRLPAVLNQAIPHDILNVSLPATASPGGSPALWIRMLFSCLVDADFLDTEAFLNPKQTTLRQGYPSLAELHRRFDRFMQEKADGVRTIGPLSTVNKVRADVLQQCRDKASLRPGLFSLTVPTGGGKTLSSMAFALEHARAHGKERVIYVIPYTSIIEQTAEVFRSALEIEDDAVLEHHSALDPSRETAQSRVACENWDAPVVVTTSVQFFESLFAARANHTRKLHNIANSVVVLDEAQLLPADFLEPILAAIRDLAAHYGVTFVLCTATQPALREEVGFGFHFKGLAEVCEIIDDPGDLHQKLRRVDLEVPEDLHSPVSWEELAEDLASHDQVLCIVNRRDDCRELFRLLPPDGSAIHLSALMCGEHRSRTIKRIRMLLHAQKPVRVISTQLVEAGVDLDFPAVYRALAGLDSIAQAAGRCNREGKLERGRVVVFVPPRPAPLGLLRTAEAGGRRSLAEKTNDPLAPERFRDYFRELYWIHGDRLDKHDILKDLDHGGRLQIRFRTAAAKFQLIDDAHQSVIVRYDNDKLIDQLRYTPPSRELLRRLQRLVVSIPRYLHAQLLAAGEIEELHPGIYVQVSTRLYHPEIGLWADDLTLHEAADLVV